MTKIKAVLFDLDGTLVDTFLDLYDATNYSMTKTHNPTRTESEIKSFVGRGVNNLVHSALGDNVKSESEAREYFIEYYNSHLTAKSLPYPGIPKLVNDLIKKGYILGVVTNKREHLAEKIVEFFFPSLFSAVVGERKGFPTKPNPDMIERALELLGVDAKETVFVGDSEIDYYTAINADVTGITCTWGFSDKADLMKLSPEYIVDYPAEILKILKTL
ncbi:MAG TPA: HAD family hydrolase [Clostridia bacterium]|jgi:phosphoglycolate phosphatase|nr:HAD family hydrolase [Clostridia bacterium]